MSQHTVTYMCNLCSSTYTESETHWKHHISTGWNKDSTRHWDYNVCICGEQYSVRVNEAHKWDVVTNTPATCVTSGQTVSKCSVCGYTKTESIDALGHMCNSANIACNKSVTCARCGEIVYGQLHTLTSNGYCTTCGATMV